MRRADIEVPNGAVDVNSWAPSACYPRGSFYPLSDTPSTRRYQITKPDFRLCSTCRSRSQAPLCLCTLRLVSIQPEGTFGRLRYTLGGDRPSQTARLTLFRARITAPPRLAPQLQSLPPILHKLNPNPMSGCSKAPRGLFALPRVTCIFTGTSISPDPSLRQRPDRYAIRAGRNLPDKEFRYLRTVIVTAAVYRGFDSELAPLLLTFRHWAGVSPYTSAFAFAETCVFAKQSPGPFHCGFDRPLQAAAAKRPFSRSYGAMLPSSLTRVLPIALVFSTRLPVSDCGTDTIDLARHFSRQHGSLESRQMPLSFTARG
jgi:hypothetical protein